MTHLKKSANAIIVTALFPQQRILSYLFVQCDPQDIPPVTENELAEVCNRVGNKKAPRLDGISNIALKTAIKAAPTLFLSIYDICLKEETFPRKWKQQ
ncbi:hypothetical protein EVAR_27907_1 [Eumeta japonica]|uniref:RNA-directed DNA polymerase from mobile element jockey n=1 Tax=Eumeta variegata TaxID=151549 RepID=A0A4C1UWY7_EUMVA|nr:hypothetical protein EVAR_27907_1 [Eumeta japonica]